jgi:hypothetical protein
LELRLKINSLNPVLFRKIGLTNTYWTLKETLEELLRKNESPLAF